MVASDQTVLNLFWNLFGISLISRSAVKSENDIEENVKNYSWVKSRLDCDEKFPLS